MQKLKRIAMIAISVVMSITCLTGCGEFDMTSIETELGATGGEHDDGTGRFGKNMQYANTLYESGFIKKSTYTTIKDNIKNVEKSFTTIVDKSNGEVDGIDEGVDLVTGAYEGAEYFDVEGSMIAWLTRGTDAEHVYDYDNDTDYLSNFICKHVYDFSAEAAGKAWWNWRFKGHVSEDGKTSDTLYPADGAFEHCDGYWEYDKTCYPIKIVPNDVEREIQEALEYPIYVLRPDMCEFLGTSDLNELKDTLQPLLVKARDGELTNDDIIKLNKYFYTPKAGEFTLKKLVEKAGGSAKSWNNMVRNTTWNPEMKTGVDAIGKDIVVIQDGGPVTMHRLQEFDAQSVENFCNAIKIFMDTDAGSSVDAKFGRYMVTRATNKHGGGIYLLEYPINRIQTIKAIGPKGQAGDHAELGLSKSGLGLNILSGKMVKYKITDGSGSSPKYSLDGTYISTSDPYYTSSFFGDGGGSSFSMFGYTKETLNLSSNGMTLSSNENVLVPQIVLMDYLESTYAPRYESMDSKLVVFGRKIRFLTNGYITHSDTAAVTWKPYPDYEKKIQQQIWSCSLADESVAKYVDLNGNPGSRSFSVTDFADALAVKRSDTCQYLCPRGETPGELAENENIVNKNKTIYDLKQVRLGSNHVVRPTLMFPSEDIAVEDYKDEMNGNMKASRQRFWTIAVKLEFSSSSLITDWIESTSTNGDSLLWFNQYLSDNGYIYNVPLKSVENYFKKYYSSEMQEAGVLMVDKDTIEDIKEMYDKEDSDHRNMVIRTVFVVTGWLLMALSMILLLLWAIDANTDLGINALEKVTLGHWIAIKYASDIPDGDTGEKSYLTGQKVLIRCMILIAVGFVLIRIDVFSIVHYLVVMFGKIASKIEEIIKGIKN